MSNPPTRMTAIDTAWLRMDSPRNLMTIVGVWIVRPALDPRALRRRLKQRLLCHARFVRKVRRDTLGATWVSDEDFDIARANA
jgi:hypothetical protein